ncbi:MFS transporter [Paenibacillus sp. 1001270B_150601_E10]|uniref:MFS transporter n=1 Tax=Paenibacillus sp. 1001270B_150601_E10 TaxID=2787079 RepID=UPI00189D8763|nr:MFS transporter [Paenibacillus sp. 1001270B_150601_E10]
MKIQTQTIWQTEEAQRRLYKRTLYIVVLSQIFGGAGLAAGVTVGALLAQDMLGTDQLAGIPTALLTLGSACASVLVGRLTQRLGRRGGLATGFLLGGLGSIGVIFATIWNSVALLFVSLFVYGAGTASNLQARYAGTDLAKKSERATAISVALVSTTFGAVAAPNLVGVMGQFAQSFGIPPLAGPFMLSAAAFLAAGIILFILLRPDPYIIARSLANNQVQGLADSQPIMNDQPAASKRGIVVGAAVMVLTQIVMVAIMTMTPVHMKHHGHGLHEVGLVIGIHIGAMYLPSLLTGMLVDKIGRKAMTFASGLTLLAAGLLAALAPADSMFLLITALALLGLGWNFGLISGTALIVDATQANTRAKTQGTVDVLVALAGASGGALSGMVVAQSSYAALSLIGGLLALILIPVMMWSQRGQNE